MKRLLRDAEALAPELVAMRRHLHQNPEVDMELQNTTAFVCERLREAGCEPQLLAGGVVATITGAKPGKCFLLRADMDALPIAEESGEPFASQNGAMHACGHDLHTAMLLGAAKLLMARREEIRGSVKLMFQPAEETLKGAKAMVGAGVLDSPAVDAAAMIHVAVESSYPPGTILVPAPGPFSFACDWFEIEVQGKGGHGAMPEKAVDPLLALSHIHLALQAIQSREVAGDEMVILTVGTMQGGVAGNVIPDTAVMCGTVRTYSPQTREFVLRRLEEIATGVAAAFRTRVRPGIFSRSCPASIVDGAVAGHLRQSLAEALGPQAVPDPSALPGASLGGSEDFAFISERVPSVMMMLAAPIPGGQCPYSTHHPKVRFDEGVLPRGAAAYAAAAMGWLNSN